MALSIQRLWNVITGAGTPTSKPNSKPAMNRRVQDAIDALLDDLDQAEKNINRDGHFKHITPWIAGCMRDAAVRGVLGTRTAGLVSLPALYSGPDEGLALVADPDGDGVDRFTEVFARREQSAYLKDAIVAGGGICEILRSGEAITKVVRRPNEFLRIWDGKVYYQDEEIPPGAGKWMVMTAALDSPWLEGNWSPLCRARAEKFLGTMHQLAFLQGLANNIILIKAPAGTTKEDKQQAAEHFSELGTNNVRVCDWDAQLLEVKSPVGSTAFDSAIKRAIDDINQIIAGQTVTSSGGNGSGFQNVRFFDAIRKSLIVEDAAMISANINEQLMPHLAPGVTRRIDLTDAAAKTVESQQLIQAAAAIKSLREIFTDDLNVDQLAKQFNIPRTGKNAK